MAPTAEKMHRGLLGICFAGLAVSLCAGNVLAGDEGGGGRRGDKEREIPVAEKITKAQDVREDSEKREELIKGLAAVTPESERDNHVVEGLLEIANKLEDDPSVRVTAIKTLGTIEKNVTRDHKAKNKYIDPFSVILKHGPSSPAAGDGEAAPVRKAVAHVFRETLEAGGLKDKDPGWKTLVEIAHNKYEPLFGLRGECILAIGDFGDVDGLQPIIDILNETDQGIKEKAAIALSNLIFAIGENSNKVNIATIRKLIEMLTDPKTGEDLKISVMQALAQLIQNGNTSAAREGLQPIKEIVAKDPNANLVIGGIKALGTIGTSEAIDPLKKAYDDNFDKAAPTKEADVKIRAAVVRAIRAVLNVQARSKQYDAKAAHEGATLLIKVVDDDSATDVKGAAVYAMRMLQNKKFIAEWPDAIESLLYLLKAPATDKAMKEKIGESLEYLTGMDYATDTKEGVAKWFTWFDTKYKGKRTAAKP
jgi:HEAT repeat protein